MPATATETTTLIALKLPRTRYTPFMARYYVRAALAQHNLGDYVDDAATVASELVTNATVHTESESIVLELCHLQDSGSLAIVVTDTSPNPPEKRDQADSAECGRGLQVVEALSARWGWKQQGTGKTVYAILTREA
jgi:anti-sigma regulatory factor (Ser/Thr protein kinase)